MITLRLKWFDADEQMNADYQDFKYNELTEKIIAVFYKFIISLVMVFWKRSMKMR